MADADEAKRMEAALKEAARDPAIKAAAAQTTGGREVHASTTPTHTPGHVPKNPSEVMARYEAERAQRPAEQAKPTPPAETKPPAPQSLKERADAAREQAQARQPAPAQPSGEKPSDVQSRYPVKQEKPPEPPKAPQPKR